MDATASFSTVSHVSTSCTTTTADFSSYKRKENAEIVIIDQKAGADISTWLKPWKNASWTLLEKVRSGELCANLVKHDLARHYFDHSTILIALQQKIGRTDYHGFCLATLFDDDASTSFLVIDILSSKPGGGRKLLSAAVDYAKSRSCKYVQLTSVASSVLFYHKHGFELALPGQRESSAIAAMVQNFAKVHLHSFKEVLANAEYVAFLRHLIQNRLTMVKKNVSLADCDSAGGYFMILYLVAPKATKRKRKLMVDQ
jgi:GNAT superfamily N-acetyltransferase